MLKNGSLNWGLGCSDKPLLDDDEIEVKTIDLGEVHVMYVKNKHHEHHHVEEEEYSEEE